MSQKVRFKPGRRGGDVDAISWCPWRETSDGTIDSLLDRSTKTHRIRQGIAVSAREMSADSVVWESFEAGNKLACGASLPHWEDVISYNLNPGATNLCRRCFPQEK